MGTTSSSTASPTVGEDSESSYISSSRITKSQDQNMALVFDTQSGDQDDLGHDTLMGLQELDSHLSIFETPADRQNGSTTPASSSDFASDHSYNASNLMPSIAVDEVSSKAIVTNIAIPSPPYVDINGKTKANGPAQYAYPTFFKLNVKNFFELSDLKTNAICDSALYCTGL